MAITSDEVNFLVYRYLQESGFMHSAFTFAYESQLAKTSVINTDLPPGALISFIQKGLHCLVDENLNGRVSFSSKDGTERECEGDFSLLSPHICRVAQSATSSARSAGSSAKTSNKRKRKQGDGSPDTVDAAKVDLSYACVVFLPVTEANGMDKLEKSPLILLSGHEKEVYGCLWNPVKNLLVSGSSDSTARIWEIPSEINNSKSLSLTPKVLNHGAGPHKDVTTLEWNHDGTLLASGTYNGKTRVWNIDGEMKHVFQYHNGPVFATRWSKSGKFLLSASFDKTVAVWDATTEAKRQQIKLHEDPILDASWKDDSTFATCSSDMKICISRVGETQADLVLTGHTDAINSVKWDPSGRLLASCSDDYSVKVWDPTKVDAAPTPEQPESDGKNETDGKSKPMFVHNFQEHKKEVYTFRWSCTGPGTANPSGPLTLASASFDGTVKIWDIESGTCIRTFEHQYVDVVVVWRRVEAAAHSHFLFLCICAQVPSVRCRLQSKWRVFG
ncbi:Wd domain-containing protein, partial [Globisporangium splendens]